MAKLDTSSPLSRRIARSFLHFLSSVDPGPGVDSEAIEVARECLAEAFNIDLSSVDDQSTNDSLVNIFSEREEIARGKGVSSVPSTSPTQVNGDFSGPSSFPVEDDVREVHSAGEDDLFGHFVGALERIHYFRRTPDGNDDQVQLDRATNTFHSAVKEMQKGACKALDQKGLAETFKSLGNESMRSKLYPDAIELYTFAIALCEDNAVYYCNRAAAYTQIRSYGNAVQDCLKSIDINPNYGKAYSRLGFAYYALGKYRDAIDKGFMKALELDPNSESVKENIRVAEQKLKEQQEREGHNQSSRSTSHQGESNHHSESGSRGHSAHSPFINMPFNMNGLPADISSMFMNMASGAYEGQGFQTRARGDTNADAEPGVRVDGNINIDVGEIPEELSGTLRSVMGMFSGAAAPPGNQPGNSSGRSASS